MGQKLGQHFLKNKKILHAIAEATELRVGETVIEIGPGHGELTEYLSAKGGSLPDGGRDASGGKSKNCKMILIEKDKILAEQLKKRFEKDKNIKIICGDALKILPRIVSSLSRKSSSLATSSGGGSLPDGKRRAPSAKNPNYIIVGNIPYYITGYLLRTIQELEKRPARTVVMIQKEVALRMVKKPPEMNLLAASVAYWADAKIVMSVPKKEFSPQPKIDSAVIALYTKKTHLKNRGKEEEKYYKTLATLFKQPRKTIKNNITLSYRSANACNMGNKEKLFEKLEKAGIHIEWRPQNLGVDEIKKVADMLYNKN